MLPFLQEIQNASKKYSVQFRGLNYGEGTQDGEFADTYNLSTDKFPCITQRPARITAGNYTKPTSLHAKGKLLVVDGTDVWYGDTKVGEVTEGKKHIATVGNYIIIFPDKKYYKVPTEDQEGEFANMEIDFKARRLDFTSNTISWVKDFDVQWTEFSTNSITIGEEYTQKLSMYVGYNYFEITRNSATTPPFPFKTGDVVNITVDGYNSGDVVIKKKEENILTFESNFGMTREYVTMTITRKAKSKMPFVAGETISITGCSETGNNKSNLVIKEVTDTTITFEEGTFTATTENGTITLTREDKLPFSKGDSVTISGCSNNGNNKESEIIIREVSDNELRFDQNAFTEATEYGDLSIKRSVPDLDFICESNYRLWGTSGNTIYGSKYSDPINFKSFEGLTGDSYNIEVGSEGEFTGIMPYSSHICFFKENTLHKLYGSKPSNYQITASNVYGVQSGSENSMQIVNEQLLYKGVNGVYAYTGGVPELISANFGNRRYSEAVACCDGEKYYISMKQGDTWNMFVYDVRKNIWLREDDTHAVDMAFHNGKVYYLDVNGGLYYIDKAADRNDIEWGATFCTIHETVNEKKGYSRFHLRLDLSAGAWLAVDIKTDNDLQWQQIYTTHNEKARTVSIPIMPMRCDSIDIRLRGKGECTVKAFIREFTVGSDV